jgi:hypothetical protein
MSKLSMSDFHGHRRHHLQPATPEDCPPEDGVQRHPALRDRTVRQALAHAADKQTLIDVVPGLNVRG